MSNVTEGEALEEGADVVVLPDLTLEETKENIRMLLRSFPSQNGMHYNQLVAEFTKKYFREIPFYNFGFNSLKDMILKMPEVVTIHQLNGQSYLIPTGSQKPSKSQRSATPQGATGGSIPPLMPPESGSSGANAKPYYKRKGFVPGPVKQNITQIIQSDPGGVKLEDFLQMYEVRHGERLNHHKLGFDNILGMMRFLNGHTIFLEGNPKDGFVILPKTVKTRPGHAEGTSKPGATASTTTTKPSHIPAKPQHANPPQKPRPKKPVTELMQQISQARLFDGSKMPHKARLTTGTTSDVGPSTTATTDVTVSLLQASQSDGNFRDEEGLERLCRKNTEKQLEQEVAKQGKWADWRKAASGSRTPTPDDQNPALDMLDEARVQDMDIIVPFTEETQPKPAAKPKKSKMPNVDAPMVNPPKPEEPKIPKDVVGPSASYPSVTMPRCHEYFEMKLSVVNSIDNFAIQRVGPDYYEKLEALMVALDFYNTRDADAYKLPPAMAIVDQVCVAMCSDDQHWHRVVITELVDTFQYVKVYFVDYGSIEVVDKYTLMLLRKKFFYLPGQAIRAGLIGMEPLEGETVFSLASRSTFLDLCLSPKYTGLIGYIPNFECQPALLCVVRYDGDSYFHVNDQLVKLNLVKVCNNLPEQGTEIGIYDVTEDPPLSPISDGYYEHEASSKVVREFSSFESIPSPQNSASNTVHDINSPTTRQFSDYDNSPVYQNSAFNTGNVTSHEISDFDNQVSQNPAFNPRSVSSYQISNSDNIPSSQNAACSTGDGVYSTSDVTSSGYSQITPAMNQMLPSRDQMEIFMETGKHLLNFQATQCQADNFGRASPNISSGPNSENLKQGQANILNTEQQTKIGLYNQNTLNTQVSQNPFYGVNVVSNLSANNPVNTSQLTPPHNTAYSDNFSIKPNVSFNMPKIVVKPKEKGDYNANNQPPSEHRKQHSNNCDEVLLSKTSRLNINSDDESKSKVCYKPKITQESIAPINNNVTVNYRPAEYVEYLSTTHNDDLLLGSLRQSPLTASDFLASNSCASPIPSSTVPIADIHASSVTTHAFHEPPYNVIASTSNTSTQSDNPSEWDSDGESNIPTYPQHTQNNHSTTNTQPHSQNNPQNNPQVDNSQNKHVQNKPEQNETTTNKSCIRTAGTNTESDYSLPVNRNATPRKRRKNSVHWKDEDFPETQESPETESYVRETENNMRETENNMRETENYENYRRESPERGVGQEAIFHQHALDNMLNVSKQEYYQSEFENAQASFDYITLDQHNSNTQQAIIDSTQDYRAVADIRLPSPVDVSRSTQASTPYDTTNMHRDIVHSMHGYQNYANLLPSDPVDVLPDSKADNEVIEQALLESRRAYDRELVLESLQPDDSSHHRGGESSASASPATQTGPLVGASNGDIKGGKGDKGLSSRIDDIDVNANPFELLTTAQVEDRLSFLIEMKQKLIAESQAQATTSPAAIEQMKKLGTEITQLKLELKDRQSKTPRTESAPPPVQPPNPLAILASMGDGTAEAQPFFKTEPFAAPSDTILHSQSQGISNSQSFQPIDINCTPLPSQSLPQSLNQNFTLPHSQNEIYTTQSQSQNFALSYSQHENYATQSQNQNLPSQNFASQAQNQNFALSHSQNENYVSQSQNYAISHSQIPQSQMYPLSNHNLISHTVPPPSSIITPVQYNPLPQYSPICSGGAAQITPNTSPVPFNTPINPQIHTNTQIRAQTHAQISTPMNAQISAPMNSQIATPMNSQITTPMYVQISTPTPMNTQQNRQTNPSPSPPPNLSPSPKTPASSMEGFDAFLKRNQTPTPNDWFVASHNAPNPLKPSSENTDIRMTPSIDGSARATPQPDIPQIYAKTVDLPTTKNEHLTSCANPVTIQKSCQCYDHMRCPLCPIQNQPPAIGMNQLSHALQIQPTHSTQAPSLDYHDLSYIHSLLSQHYEVAAQHRTILNLANVTNNLSALPPQWQAEILRQNLQGQVPLNPATLNLNPVTLNPTLNTAPFNPAPLNSAPLNPTQFNPTPQNPASQNPVTLPVLLTPASFNPAVNSRPHNLSPHNQAPHNQAPHNQAPLHQTSHNPPPHNPTPHNHNTLHQHNLSSLNQFPPNHVPQPIAVHQVQQNLPPQNLPPQHPPTVNFPHQNIQFQQYNNTQQPPPAQ